MLLCSCSNDEAPPESAEEKDEQPTNRIEIPASVRSNLGITFTKVERRNVANTIRVPGSFALQPHAKHEYRMMLSGHVELLVNQFDKVNAGDPLYRFRSLQLLALQQKAALAEAVLAKARTKYQTAEKRQTALANTNFKRAELDAQVAELGAELAEKQAELNAATAALKVVSETDKNGRQEAGGWVLVRSREAGNVQSLAVTNGSFAEESSLILTVVDPAKIRFQAMGLQRDLSRFKNGQKVRIVPPQTRDSDLNESIDGTLQIGLEADPQLRTVQLFAIPGELQPWSRPGVSGFMEISEDPDRGVVLAIPRSAVVKDGIVHVFFKRDPNNPNKAIRVEADLGVDDGRWIEIKSDLGPNDEVVLNGAYELKLASSQSGASQKGGHFHADGTYHDSDH